jgi:hypothetical protein
VEGRALAQRSVECLNGRRQKWREWLLGAAKQGWSLRGTIDESIGVDVGGSFADSVLCDMNTGQVPISAKIMS